MLTSMRLSPLAALVLQHHRARPGEPMYDVAALGTRFPSREDLDQLAAAYRELEEAGLIESTDEVERFRGRFFYMYVPVDAGRPMESLPVEGSVGGSIDGS
jgi:hypothetical protein